LEGLFGDRQLAGNRDSAAGGAAAGHVFVANPSHDSHTTPVLSR